MGILEDLAPVRIFIIILKNINGLHIIFHLTVLNLKEITIFQIHISNKSVNNISIWDEILYKINEIDDEITIACKINK